LKDDRNPLGYKAVSAGEQTSAANAIEQDPRLAEFVAAFRESKHYLLNSIAIWMAQAELGTRNPDFHEKLVQSILERSEKLVALTRETEAKLKAFAPYAVDVSPSRHQPI
jgi:23S rRNA A1618 N6-methylase RlmF